MRILNKAALLAASALAAPVMAPAIANAAPAQQAEVDAVVVTAARTVLPANALPLTIEMIDRAQLEQQAAISGSVVDAVANLTPSFSPTRQKLSGAGETLRGRSPLYAINGIPQSTPLRDGARDGFTIDPFFVDRVELIYGSNALQGIGGTGGIVNQVTVGPPTSDGTTGRVLVQGYSDTRFKGDSKGFKTAGLIGWKQGAFDATGGVAYDQRGAFYDGKGRRIGVDSTQGDVQDSKAVNVFGRLGYAVSNTARIDLIGSVFRLRGDADYLARNGDYRIDLPTTGVRGRAPGKASENRTQSLAVSFTDRALLGGNFMSQVFFNRSRDTYGGEVAPIASFQDARIAPIGTLFDQSQNRSRKYGGKFSYERAFPGFEALTATVGFDALFDKTEQRLIATNRTWVPPAAFRSLAPFAQANLKLFDGKVRLAGGVRNENVRIKIDDYTTLASYKGGFAVSGGAPKFSDTLFNAGAIYEPLAGLRLYASYAEGYTVPDVGRIARAIDRPGVDIDTYVNVDPIVSNNEEIGAELKRGPIDATATYFWSSSTKGSLLVLVNGSYEVQRQRVEIEGLELNLNYQTPLPGLRLSAGYAKLLGKTDNNGDGRVETDLDGANISPNRVNLAASYALGRWSGRVQTQFYLKRDFQGLQPVFGFRGYSVTDASIRYQTDRRGAVYLSVQNLFDNFYIDYYSDTVRPTDNVHYFAGRGRTFTLGWDYRF
jgi:iron complex outermembrane receptor protein